MHTQEDPSDKSASLYAHPRGPSREFVCTSKRTINGVCVHIQEDHLGSLCAHARGPFKREFVCTSKSKRTIRGPCMHIQHDHREVLYAHPRGQSGEFVCTQRTIRRVCVHILGGQSGEFVCKRTIRRVCVHIQEVHSREFMCASNRTIKGVYVCIQYDHQGSLCAHPRGPSDRSGDRVCACSHLRGPIRQAFW